MQFTKVAIVALLLATVSAVTLEKQDNNRKGISYQFDEPTLNDANTNKAAKDRAHAAATNELNGATAAKDAAATAAADAKTANGASKAAMDTAITAFKASDYKTPEYYANEATAKAAIATNEGKLDAALKTADTQTEKQIIQDRKQRDFNTATAKKAAADANQADNAARFANEKDQLKQGTNQDRTKKVMEDTEAKTSEIIGKHGERVFGNDNLKAKLAN